ncbi:hypothetical protein B4U36_21410, partial [Klebsiella pneumoniae]
MVALIGLTVHPLQLCLFKRFRQAGGQIDPGRITGAGLAGKTSAGSAGYSTWSGAGNAARERRRHPCN